MTDLPVPQVLVSPSGGMGSADPEPSSHEPRHSHRLASRLKTYFLTGLAVVAPVAITLYITWWFVKAVDAWVKPLVPSIYDPDTYLPIAVPGFGLLFALILITGVGALAANLIGRTLINTGDSILARMPILRNIYRGLKQIFESVAVVAKPGNGKFAKVGLIEFPAKGLWSLVYVTADATGEIEAIAPGGETDHVIVWVPTGFMPPTGNVVILPRKDVIPLSMSVEDAAKIVISAGMVMPDYQQKLKELAEAARAQAQAQARPAA